MFLSFQGKEEHVKMTILYLFFFTLLWYLIHHKVIIEYELF
jgi:hypothetical protein